MRSLTQRHRFITASLSRRQPPPRQSRHQGQPTTPSPPARDGGRGASAAANRRSGCEANTARQDRAVFVSSNVELGRPAHASRTENVYLTFYHTRLLMLILPSV